MQTLHTALRSFVLRMLMAKPPLQKITFSFSLLLSIFRYWRRQHFCISNIFSAACLKISSAVMFSVLQRSRINGARIHLRQALNSVWSHWLDSDYMSIKSTRLLFLPWIHCRVTGGFDEVDCLATDQSLFPWLHYLISKEGAKLPSWPFFSCECPGRNKTWK